jgi:hypothetical protein
MPHMSANLPIGCWWQDEVLPTVSGGPADAHGNTSRYSSRSQSVTAAR